MGVEVVVGVYDPVSSVGIVLVSSGFRKNLLKDVTALVCALVTLGFAS